MTPQTIDIVEACTRDSHGATGVFPQLVARLAAAGVERYHADLRRAERTYYMPDGASHVTPTPPVEGEFAAAFDPAQIAAAVRASQASQLDYDQFLTRIARAGCTSYLISIAGRRAVYLGRTGESYVEHFPPLA